MFGGRRSHSQEIHSQAGREATREAGRHASRQGSRQAGRQAGKAEEHRENSTDVLGRQGIKGSKEAKLLVFGVFGS